MPEARINDRATAITESSSDDATPQLVVGEELKHHNILCFGSADRARAS